jgi:hypothetical protein
VGLVVGLVAGLAVGGKPSSSSADSWEIFLLSLDALRVYLSFVSRCVFVG